MLLWGGIYYEIGEGCVWIGSGVDGTVKTFLEGVKDSVESLTVIGIRLCAFPDLWVGVVIIKSDKRETYDGISILEFSRSFV